MFNTTLRLYFYLNIRIRVAHILNILDILCKLDNREKRRDTCVIRKREVCANNKENRE